MYNIYNKAIKDMKNYWNKCFTSTRVLLLVLLVISSTMLFATIYNNNMESSMDIAPPVEDKDSTQVWIPTKQDIEYQDSMYAIIERTSADVDTIKEAIDHILYKLERIQYVDGTSDSIRYPIKNQ
jgi:hypothetical protein|tara:strand:+ start:233 stop:607 length:375 start_codon:yes stop_codon:yes gene_type:complete